METTIKGGNRLYLHRHSLSSCLQLDLLMIVAILLIVKSVPVPNEMVPLQSLPSLSCFILSYFV